MQHMHGTATSHNNLFDNRSYVPIPAATYVNHQRDAEREYGVRAGHELLLCIVGRSVFAACCSGLHLPSLTWPRQHTTRHIVAALAVGGHERKQNSCQSPVVDRGAYPSAIPSTDPPPHFFLFFVFFMFFALCFGALVAIQ